MPRSTDRGGVHPPNLGAASADPRVRPVASRQETGARAETLVCEYLERQGFAIVARNARVERLELDIVARKGELLVFCEVRARTSDEHMYPSQSVAGAKALRVRRAAAAWLRQHRPQATRIRIDVASVVFDTPAGRVTYLEGAL